MYVSRPIKNYRVGECILKLVIAIRQHRTLSKKNYINIF